MIGASRFMKVLAIQEATGFILFYVKARAEKVIFIALYIQTRNPLKHRLLIIMNQHRELLTICKKQ